MSRRKKSDELEPNANGVAVQAPAAQATPAPEIGAAAAERKPLRVFSIQVGQLAYVQCAVWEYELVRPDGSSLLNYECTIRKRQRDSMEGSWKTCNSFHASEFYALKHVLDQATGLIADRRTAEIPF